jgi:hypothetical protein
MAASRREEDWVLLGQSGYSVAAITEQVERICNSEKFDNSDGLRRNLAFLVNEALSGRVPTAADINKEFKGKGTYAFVTTGRVRTKLKDYYATSRGKRDEIQLLLLPKSYIIVTRRNAAESWGEDIPPKAYILEPADNSENPGGVTVRGKIHSLDPDLRVWLVVRDADGVYYLQGRISRRSPTFQMTTRTGRMQTGQHEGGVFEILLVSADAEADYQFHGNMPRCDEGFGQKLPEDTFVLASIKVVRRDIPQRNFRRGRVLPAPNA